MVRYTMAAQSALLVLQQLVTACSTQQTLELPGTNTSGEQFKLLRLLYGLPPMPPYVNEKLRSSELACQLAQPQSPVSQPHRYVLLAVLI